MYADPRMTNSYGQNYNETATAIPACETEPPSDSIYSRMKMTNENLAVCIRICADILTIVRGHNNLSESSMGKQPVEVKADESMYDLSNMILNQSDMLRELELAIKEGLFG